MVEPVQGVADFFGGHAAQTAARDGILLRGGYTEKRAFERLPVLGDFFEGEGCHAQAASTGGKAGRCTW